MSLHTLTQALPIVAAAYGRKFGVPVQVGGTQARTDGQVIYIPHLHPDAHAKLLAYGYVTHEAGHVRHTDFQVPDLATPLGRFVAGVIEDVRIENAMIHDYPGCRVTLDAVIDALINTGELVPVQTSDPPAAVMGNGLLALARYHYRRQGGLQPHARIADQVMRQVFTPRLVQRLLGLMTAIPGLQHTGESMALAQKLVALMAEEAQSPPPASPEEPPQESPLESPQASSQESPQASAPDPDPAIADGEDPTGSAGGAPGAALAPQAGGDPDSACPESTGSQADGDGPPAGTDTTGTLGVTPVPASPTHPSRRNGALQATLGAGAGDLPPDIFAQVATVLNNQSDHTPTLLPTLAATVGDPVRGRQALSRVKAHSAVLTARLQGLVQAHHLTHQRTVPRGRRLAPQQLHRVAVGDGRIFQRREQHASPNTALHLVVDLSYSMAEGQQDQIALDAAMALALALEPLRGVSRAVTAFPGHTNRDTLMQLVGHGEGVAANPGVFVQRGSGSTPMTGALWYAAANLVGRQEPRKVLMVLTDGQPDHFASARDLVRQATGAGIEVIGVGIQCDVSRLFPLAIRIDTIGDLKGELFRIAEKLLLS